MAFSLIKQSRKIIKKTFVASLASNKPSGCIFCKKINKAISGFACVFVVCQYKIFHISTHLYTHIINKLLHGWFLCTLFITYILVVMDR